MKRLALIVLMVCSLSAEAQEVRRALPVEVAPATKPNEVARFLAGVPLPEDSELAPLQKAPGYTEHVKALAKLTARYDQNYFSKMRSWSASQLAPRISMQRPVYYFFGGPDAVSALALYPEAPVYILGGLESVGSVAVPQTLTPEAVAEGLANLRQSVNVILSYGHFITKDMKAELDRTNFNGVLPLIYTFIVLTGGEVVATDYVGVKRDGSMVPTVGMEKGKLPGVKVTFRRAPGATEQVIYYVQANVADDALKSQSGAVLTWAGEFGQGNVYLKAASYLMHEAYFSRIRSFLLGKGASVLQDDSGIPYRFFQDGNWRVWLFGRYTGTLDIFKQYHQADMAGVFASPGTVQELPFGTGYKWRVGESNLLLAVRQQVPRAVPVR